MIIERAEIPVVAGQDTEFEGQLTAAAGYLRSAEGCRGLSLLRGLENPWKYLLLVEWESLQAHQAFTRTEAFAKLGALIRPFFNGKPNTEHFAPLGGNVTGAGPGQHA